MKTAKARRRLDGPDDLGDRHPGFRAVGIPVSKLAAPIAVKRGGGLLVRLKTDWSVIVGPEWALIAWPVGYGRDGVLKLRTIPAAALELQHRAPLLIERINLYLGRAAVTRLVLIQAALPLASNPPLAAANTADTGAVAAADPRLSDIGDPGLRAALGRLARAVNDTR